MAEYPPDVPLKRCSHCHQMLPATKDFFTTSKTKDGFHNMCRRCHTERAGERANDHQLPPEGTLKTCAKCHLTKPATTEYFKSHRRAKDHLYYICRACTQAMYRKPPRYIVPEGYKRCPVCGENKPATTEYFYPSTNAKSGLNSQCKQCCKQEHKNRKVTINPLITHKTCRQCGKDYPATAEYFHRNRLSANGLRSICKQCAKEASQDYRTCNRETILRRFTIWQHAHRAHRTTVQREREARKNGIPGTHTAQEIREQYERQKGKCYYCHHKVKWGEHHVDHTFPISRPYARNSIDHLVVTCKPCNESKGNKYPWEWPQGNRLL